MKKYRCPNCGEECLNWFDKCWFRGRRKSLSRTSSRAIHYCRACGGCYTSHQRNLLVSILFALPWALGIPILLCLCFMRMDDFGNIPFKWGVAVLLYEVVALLVIKVGCDTLFGTLVPFDIDHNESVMPVPNGVVILTEVKAPIRYLDIKGLRFCPPTEGREFYKAFPDGMVPVIFHCKKGRAKANQHIRVTLLRKPQMPAELLQVNRRFTVVDNGREIASGFLYEVVPNQ